MKNASKTPAKKTSTKKLDRGTVGWLIEELKKFPKDMHVLHGDHDDNYYDGYVVEVLKIREGNVDEERGEDVVCITAF